MTPYRSDGEGHDCEIHSAYNVTLLLLGERSAAYEVSLLHRSTKLASARCRPHTEGRPEVSDLLKLGHLGPISQNSWGHIGIQKVIILRHWDLQSIACRFNWLFEKKYYGRIFNAHLFEAYIVDHVIVIDSRRWNFLIYDSPDKYPITLSSSALFFYAGLGENKVKIIDLYEVFTRQRIYEIRHEVERELLTSLRVSAPRLNLRIITSIVIAWWCSLHFLLPHYWKTFVYDFNELWARASSSWSARFWWYELVSKPTFFVV